MKIERERCRNYDGDSGKKNLENKIMDFGHKTALERRRINKYGSIF